MLPAALVTLLLGGATLAALGLALGALARTSEQAMPLSQLTFLPISFISGIWFPLDGAPGWVDDDGGRVPALAHRARLRRVLRARHPPARASPGAISP